MAQQGDNFMDRLRKIKAEREPQADKGLGSANPLQTSPPSCAYVDLEPPLVTDKKARRRITPRKILLLDTLLKGLAWRFQKGGRATLSNSSPLTWDSIRASACRPPQWSESC